MDFFSHLLIGAFIAAFALNSLGQEFIILAIVMAFIPDFDVFLGFFRSVRRSKLLSHKGVSHSFFAALIVSAPVALIFSLITGASFLIVWLIAFLFYSLHVILDGLAASKIPLFYPFSKKRFRFFIDRAINPLLALISGIIIIFYMIIRFISPEIYYSDLTNYFLICYLGYLSYRAIMKIWIQAHMPSNVKMVPGILPFSYFIYENHNSDSKISFNLSKKSIFSSKTVQIIESEIKKNSEEMEFYEKALTLSEDYLFFLKWEAIIPLFQHNEYWITVKLFLAEAYASGSAYSFEAVFDKRSKKLIHKSDSFGSIINNSKNSE
jgi:inner membrane protein